MGYPKWLVYDGKKNPLKWMRTGGTRISGNHHYDQAQTPNKNCLGYHWKMAVDAFLGGLTTQAPNMVGWCWISTQSCGPDCYSNDSIQVYQRETDSLNIRNRTGLEHNFLSTTPQQHSIFDHIFPCRWKLIIEFHHVLLIPSLIFS